MLMSVCDPCPPCETSCDLYFNSFSSADLSEFTEWYLVGDATADTTAPEWTSGGGTLTLGDDDDIPPQETSYGALTVEVSVPGDVLNGWVRFVEAGMVASVSTLNPDGAGVAIGVPFGMGSDTTAFPNSEPWAVLWWSAGRVLPTPGSGTGGPVPSGTVRLAWGESNATNGTSLVRWGMDAESGPPTLRLEWHDVSSGAGTYDLHCYVNDVLCHVQCDVDLAGLDPETNNIGAYGSGAGSTWDYLCIGQNFITRGRHCTHTPNQYDITVDTTTIALDSPCVAISPEEGEDEAIGTQLTYWLRKQGGGVGHCYYESRARLMGYAHGVDLATPLWALTITEVATDTYDFVLVLTTQTDPLISAHGTEQLVWKSLGLTPYPSGNVTLTLDEDDSTCTVTGMDTVELVRSECGDIGDIPTDCCEDMPRTLPVRRAGLFPASGEIEYTPKPTGGGGFWPSWVGTITDGVCSTSIELVCKPCDGTSGAGCVDTAEGSAWHLSIDGGGLRYFGTVTCDPFSVVVPLDPYDGAGTPQFVLGCTTLIIGEDDGSISDVDSLDVTFTFAPDNPLIPDYVQTRTLTRDGCNSFSDSYVASSPCGNKNIDITFTLDDEDTATITVVVDGSTFFTGTQAYTCDPFSASFPGPGVATFCGEPGTVSATVQETP